MLPLDSDPGARSQVLMILISNALVHAFEGREPGSLTVEGRREAGGWVLLRVRDDGVGIPKEHLGHIFEPFFTTRLGQGGSGLGLHLLHNMVTGVLGGRVAVHGTVGAGTTFTIELPDSAGTVHTA